MEWQVYLDDLTREASKVGLLKEFSLMKTDVQRLTFCQEQSFIRTSLDKWLNKNIHSAQVKCLDKSLKFKTSADSAFFQHLDDKAIQLYGMALLFSPRSEVSVLFGNRSAVLFTKGLWEKCIVDIDCALNEGFFPEKQWKLYKRKGAALMNLKKYSESQLSFKKCLTVLPTEFSEERNQVELLLSSVCKFDLTDAVAVNEVVELDSFIPVNGFDKILTRGSSSLEVAYDSKQGRYIFAKEDIPNGSIIISEKPYAAVLLPHWYKTHCQLCFDKVISLFPCYECAEVVFCSLSCYNDAWATYHRFECKKLSLMEKVGIAHLSLRIVLVSDAKDLLRFLSLNKFTDSPTLPSSKIEGCNDQGIYRADYESVYFLSTHSDRLPIEDLFQYSVAGFLLYKLLINSSFFKIHTVLQQHHFDVGSLLIRHIQQLICNAHAVTCLSAEKFDTTSVIDQEQVRIATAIYPTTSLLNHSCEPTILNCFYKNQLIVKVVKDVVKGEQIFNCYGPHYKRMRYEDRRAALMQQYFFVCSCEHCVNQNGCSNKNGFICFKCKLPLYNEEKCTSCDTDFCKDIYVSKANRCDELFLNAMRLLSLNSERHSVEKVLELFLECLNHQKEIYIANHFLLSRSYDVVGKCYAMLEDYESALKFVKKSVLVIKTIYGDQSIEYTNEILKLTDLFMHVVHNGKITYINEALDFVDEGIKLVHLNKQPDCSDLVDLEQKSVYLKNVNRRHSFK
ncbi:SET and MYND domain-containing protein 4 [Hydra vulgaris]|uniref:Protein-lysine N-methyltransferase SMYD4 n=1 Tax=Hydra vulgaris TaxID=6087 RepID=A0ABM4CTI9_HYDVU